MVNRFEIKRVTLGYKERKAPLAENLSVEAHGGELVALLGRNGVGKSTLLKTMAGVMPPLQGEVMLNERSVYDMTVAERARQMAFVTTENVSVIHLRVSEVVAMGRAPYTGWFGRLSEEDERIAGKALEWVGMTDFAEKGMDTLSDGERQRVMIARALAQDTPVMLLDEPTAFLDLPNRYQIVLLLKRLAHDLGKIMIFSSHDLAIAMQICDRLWVMSRPEEGGMASGSPAQLMESGGLDAIFKGTPLRLVGSEGAVKLKNDKE